MKQNDDYRKFQDLIFQEIADQEKVATEIAFAEFVKYANSKGFSLEKLIDLSNSGMSGSDLWKAVHSN